MADVLRRATGRRDLRRHDHDGRRIPRARDGQQRARTEKRGPVAYPPLRRAIRGLRRHRSRCDRAVTRFRYRFTGSVQVPGRKRRRAGNPQVQGRRAVLSRGHFGFRLRWPDHQLVEAVTAAVAQYFIPLVFPRLQIRPESACDHNRGGSEPDQRQSQYRHCPSADGGERRLSRCDDAAYQSRQLREILRVHRPALTPPSR
jgi:hypothetical protein